MNQITFFIRLHPPFFKCDWTVSIDTNRFATAASIPGHRFAATAFFSDKFATAAADDRVATAGNIATNDRVTAAGNIAAGNRVAAAGDIAAGDRIAAAGNIAAGDRVTAAAVGTFFWFSFISDECLISFTAIFDTLSFGHH